MNEDDILNIFEQELEPLSYNDMMQGGLLWSIIDMRHNPEEYTDEKIAMMYEKIQEYAERWVIRYGQDILDHRYKQ